MSRILAPVAAATYRNGHKDWYGAVEIDAGTGEELWRFDAVTTDLETAQITQTGQNLTHSGFRPASVDRLADGRTLIAGWRRGVFVDEDGDVHQSFTHELMNDTHEIQRTEAGTYLVAATGMDSLILLDEEFDELWRWHMWEHVDQSTRPGQYYPHRLWYRDARNLALSPDDRYHFNYATFIKGDGSGGDGTLLCSALNYGVFTVDVATGEIIDEFTDLDECHNPFLQGEPGPLHVKPIQERMRRVEGVVRVLGPHVLLHVVAVVVDRVLQLIGVYLLLLRVPRHARQLLLSVRSLYVIRRAVGHGVRG